MVMTGLRLKRGVHKPSVLARTGIAIEQILDDVAVARLVQQGLMIDTSHYMSLSNDGLLVLDSVVAAIVKDDVISQ
jgi:coproporphyrinogen III oxidase-like Fe-S oxidoreductase